MNGGNGEGMGKRRGKGREMEEERRGREGRCRVLGTKMQKHWSQIYDFPSQNKCHLSEYINILT